MTVKDTKFRLEDFMALQDVIDEGIQKLNKESVVKLHVIRNLIKNQLLLDGNEDDINSAIDERRVKTAIHRKFEKSKQEGV